MAAAGTIAAQQAARRAAGRRPASDQRHRPRAALRVPLGRCPGNLRPAQNTVQPLRALGRKGRLAGGVRGPRRCRRATGGGAARQHSCEGASLRCGWQRGQQVQALGISRGGRATKIHALSDGQGRPLAFLLTPGQAADCCAAEALLRRLLPGALVMTDRAYDTDAVRQQIQNHGAVPNIRPSVTAAGNPALAQSSIAAATPSSACSAASRTSAASPRATTSRPPTSSPPSNSPQSSATGYEAGP